MTKPFAKTVLTGRFETFVYKLMVRDNVEVNVSANADRRETNCRSGCTLSVPISSTVHLR